MLSPSTSTFHLIFSVSLQLTGGLPFLAAPVLSGPRHVGQKSPLEPAYTSTDTRNITIVTMIVKLFRLLIRISLLNYSLLHECRSRTDTSGQNRLRRRFTFRVCNLIYGMITNMWYRCKLIFVIVRRDVAALSLANISVLG